MDTTSKTPVLDTAIAEKQAEIAAANAEAREKLDVLYGQLSELRRQQAVAEQTELVDAIAEAVGGEPEKVGAFLIRLSEHTNYGFGYLASILGPAVGVEATVRPASWTAV